MLTLLRCWGHLLTETPPACPAEGEAVNSSAANREIRVPQAYVTGHRTKGQRVIRWGDQQVSPQVQWTSLVPLSTPLPTSVASTQGTSFWLYSNPAGSSLVGALFWHPQGPAHRDPSRSPSGIRTHSSFCVLGPGPLKGQEEGTQLPKSQALQEMF